MNKDPYHFCYSKGTIPPLFRGYELDELLGMKIELKRQLFIKDGTYTIKSVQYTPTLFAFTLEETDVPVYDNGESDTGFWIEGVTPSFVLLVGAKHD